MTTASKDSVLYCPECEYNLTGLTENRCPECGTEFDPKQIQELVDDLPKPLSAMGFVGLIAWPILILPPSLEFTNRQNYEFSFGVLLIIAVLGIPVNAGYLVHRLLATWRDRARKSPFFNYGVLGPTVLFILVLVAQFGSAVFGIYLVHFAFR